MLTISFTPVAMAAMPNSFLSVVSCFHYVQVENCPWLGKADGRKSLYPSQRGVASVLSEMHFTIKSC